MIDPDPRRHGPGHDAERLRLLERGTAAEILLAALAELPGGLPDEPAAWRREPRLAYALARLPEAAWREASRALVAGGEVRLASGRIALVEAEPPAPAAPEPLPPDLRATAVRALAALRADGAEPRSVQALADDLGIGREETTAVLAALELEGHLRRIAPDVYIEPETLAELERRAVGLAAERGSISLAELRDELRTSRKYAQALVEHLDREGLTVRRGDRHLPRRAPTAEP